MTGKGATLENDPELPLARGLRMWKGIWWFSRHAGDGSTVGLDGLRGLLQP